MSLESSFAPFYRHSRESETLLINQMSLAKAANNQTVYKFGFGQSPFPVPAAIVTTMAKAAHRKEYMAVQGDLSLRQGIATFHNQQEGRDWHSNDLIVGTGSKILLYCVMASFAQAEVLLPAPSWVSYAPQADLAGHPCHWLHTSFDTQWKLTPDHIVKACAGIHSNAPKVLILNYPSNPTGQTYSHEELAALAEVLREHQVLVIADEIYSFLTFDDQTAYLEHYYPEGVVTTSGLSKWCGAGGWRIGYVHLPPNLAELKKRVIGVASETYSCAPSPIQVAATQAYEDIEQAKQFLAQQRKTLADIATQCADKLIAVGVKVHRAQGGFYLFPDFSGYQAPLEERGIRTSEELMSTIMHDTGVALLPGTAFGVPSDSLTARLAYVDFDGAAALDGASPQQVFAHALEGIDKLCAWLQKLSLVGVMKP